MFGAVLHTAPSSTPPRRHWRQRLGTTGLALAVAAGAALVASGATPAGASASGDRYVGTARAVPVGANPAIDGMSAYVEHRGSNPRGSDVSPNTTPLHEPFAPSGDWVELDRWEDWAGHEAVTVMGFPRNKDTTWSQMTESAVRVVEHVFTSVPERTDGEERVRVLSLPLNTTESTLADVARGKYDWAYRQIATSLAEHFPNAIVRLGWEAQGYYDWSVRDPANPRGYGMDAADYIAAYRHVHDLMMATPGANFEWGFDTQQWGFAKGKGQLLYPGDAYVDYVGITFYDAGVNNDGTERFYRWHNRPNLDALADFAKQRNKAMYLPEFGATSTSNQTRAGRTSGDNAVFIEETLRWINDNDVAFYHYWHRWDVSRLGPYKLTPVHATLPTWDGKQQSGFKRQSTPKSIMPRASQAWQDTIDDIARDSDSPAATTGSSPTTTAPETTTSTSSPDSTTTTTTTTTIPETTPAPAATVDEPLPAAEDPAQPTGDTPVVTVDAHADRLSISWIMNRGSSLSQVRHREPDARWNWQKPTTATAAELTGLTPNTSYDVEVRTLVGWTWGPWAKVSAATMAPIVVDTFETPAPGSASIDVVRSGSIVTAAWFAPDALLFQARARTNDTRWSWQDPTEATSTTFEFPADQVVTVQVRTLTSSGWGSWTAVQL